MGGTVSSAVSGSGRRRKRPWLPYDGNVEAAARVEDRQAIRIIFLLQECPYEGNESVALKKKDFEATRRIDEAREKAERWTMPPLPREERKMTRAASRRARHTSQVTQKKPPLLRRHTMDGPSTRRSRSGRLALGDSQRVSSLRALREHGPKEAQAELDHGAAEALRQEAELDAVRQARSGQLRRGSAPAILTTDRLQPSTANDNLTKKTPSTRVLRRTPSEGSRSPKQKKEEAPMQKSPSFAPRSRKGDTKDAASPKAPPHLGLSSSSRSNKNASSRSQVAVAG